MNPRATRAGSLSRELLEVMSRLADEVTGIDAALFLDRLARCSTFTEGELAEAGAAAIVERALELLGEAEGVLGEAAAHAIDLNALLERAYRVADGQDTGASGLALEALLVASVAGRLAPSKVRERALEVSEEVTAIVEGSPAAFEDARGVALDRARFERPSRLPPAAREFVAALRSTTELAGLDEASELEPANAEAAALMKRALDGSSRRASQESKRRFERPDAEALAAIRGLWEQLGRGTTTAREFADQVFVHFLEFLQTPEHWTTPAGDLVAARAAGGADALEFDLSAFGLGGRFSVSIAASDSGVVRVVWDTDTYMSSGWRIQFLDAKTGALLRDLSLGTRKRLPVIFLARELGFEPTRQPVRILIYPAPPP